MRESGARGPVLPVSGSCLSQGRAELRGEQPPELEQPEGLELGSWSSPGVGSAGAGAAWGWGALEPEQPGGGGTYTGEEQLGLGEEYPIALG